MALDMLAAYFLYPWLAMFEASDNGGQVMLKVV